MPTSTPTDNLDRFLRAVRRRWMAVRAAEYVGLCVLGACVLALFLLPILMWRAEPALPLVITMIGVALVAGAITGVVRRPDLFSAAGEADRQLDLADLLSTALATRERAATDPWAALVVATADARCRQLAPNDVILNRFGGRAWGGIGLATALVLTLALTTASPRRTAARSASSVSDLTPRLAHQPSPPSANQRTSPSAQARRAPDRHVGDARETSTDDASSDTVQAANAALRSTSPANGSGAGLATSDAPPHRTPPSNAVAPGSPGAATGDDSAGGAARSTPDGVGRDIGFSAGRHEAPTPSPAWESTSWPAARDEALSAVRDGRVPDAYRDLVRTYFTEQPK